MLALGIDTGGTFTDSVIYNLAEGTVVAKAKAPTTYHDLSMGIRNSINKLSFKEFQKIKLVSLSTTMATNAIVEGRGCEVGLILIGEMPNGPLPVKHYAVVRGGHDIKGNPREDLDLKEVKQVLDTIKGKVEAVAVSGFSSVRNPEHELKAKKLIEQNFNLPVVCGHQLTTSLGFHERSVTAALNAKLIPIITGLINSVKSVLAEKEINDAQLMVVKGDGTLMSMSMAVEKPIETILSGPAASIIGATVLTEVSNALVLDMGGTTTDIAVLKNNVPRINPEGATVGGWLTRVEAADIYTHGLGGDSCLRVTRDRELLIGPQKIRPLCVMGSEYPYLFNELEQQGKNLIKLRPDTAADVYMLVRMPDISSLTETERSSLEILATGAHTLFYLANALGKNPFSFNLDRLVSKGIVAKAGVTPTDILHASGACHEWDRETALLGTRILADTMRVPVGKFIKNAFDEIVNGLCLKILQSVLDFEGAPAELTGNLKSNYLINKLLQKRPDEILDAVLKLGIPIIGIGAPVAAYLPQVALKLNSELIIPENSDVANAVGAAAGKVMEKTKVLISSSSEGYNLYSQWERKKFADLQEAKQYALEQAEHHAKRKAEEAGTKEYEVIRKCNDVFAKAGLGPHVETIVEVTVIGRPKW